MATRGDQLTGPCGDFDAPSLTISTPATSEKYVQTLTISAVASDASSVARMTFQADGKEIRNFTGTDVASGKAVKLDWQGAKKLSFGPHTITVIALDPQGNTVTKSVQVTRVKTLPATLKTRIKIGKVKIGKGRKASVSGRVHEDRERRAVGQGPRQLAAEARQKWKTIHCGAEAGQQALHLQAEAQGRRHLARRWSSTSTSRPTRPRRRRRRPCASSTEPDG